VAVTEENDMVDKRRTEDFAEGKRRLDEIGIKLGDLFGKPESGASTSAGGLFSGLGGLIDTIGKLAAEAEKSGGSSDRSGEVDFGSKSGAKGVYGFSVRTLGGDRNGEVKIEPFGNIKRTEEGRVVEVQQVREPMVDLFEEADHILVVAEVPGVTQEEVQLDLQDDILTFSAEKGTTRYRKELLLPRSFAAEQMSHSCHNGLLEIRLNK
jgi:HSP20 family protein